jgi:hypothetical protein
MVLCEAGGSRPDSAADVPAFLRRGMPGSGHAAIASLAGTWRVPYEVDGTLGRSGNEPPIVSDDIRTRREWVGYGRFLEDTTEGTLMGAPSRQVSLQTRVSLARRALENVLG